MYPIGFSTVDGKVRLVLFKECKFVKEMSKTEKAIFIRNVKQIFDFCLEKLYNHIVEVFFEIDNLKMIMDFHLHYPKSILLNKEINFEKIVSGIINGVDKRFFLSVCQDCFPKNDFYLCLKNSIFNFVINAQRVDQETVLLKKIKGYEN